MIPLEVTIDIPSKAHEVLVGKAGANLQTYRKQYPDVQMTFPSLDSPSNMIHLKGQAEQAIGLKKRFN